MGIALLTRGTRGDVQPMLILGAELRLRGHEVIVGTPPNLLGFADNFGFRARSMGPDSEIFLRSPEGQATLAGNNAKALAAGLAKLARDHLAQTYRGLLDTVDGPDGDICGILQSSDGASPPPTDCSSRRPRSWAQLTRVL